MPAAPFPFLRFHLQRLWEASPGAVAALAAASLALLLALATWAAQWQKAEDTAQATEAVKRTVSGATPAAEAGGAAQAALPEFNSAQFVAALLRVADETSLPVDEVSLTLDDAASQPYLRYRVKLSVSSRYPVVRRFVDRLRGELAHVTLDAIACKREAITDVDLDCDLSLSAFYKKAGNG